MINRIRRWPEEASGSEGIGERAEEVEVVWHADVPCTFFLPLHYEPAYEYPLLVWLHGPGDDERQLRRIMPHVSLRNYLAVGPRGCCVPDPGSLGYQWRQTEPAVAEAERRVFQSIRLVGRKYRIAPDRVFLGGYQTGGTMALRIGLRHPDRFAGVISIGGPFPQRCAALCRYDEARKLPVLIAQGLHSPAYPLETSYRELQLYFAAAMNVMLRLYPCDGELTTQMLLDMNEWMMAQAGIASQGPAEGVSVRPGDAN